VARKRKKNSSGGIGTIVGVVLLLGIIGSFFGGNDDSAPSSQERPADYKKVTEYDFSANKAIEQSGATSWIFQGKFKPPLILSEPNAFIQSVNKALRAVSLPAISEAVPEREELTGSRVHRGEYLWKGYEKGRLIVQRSLCKDASYEYYDCIWKITIGSRR